MLHDMQNNAVIHGIKVVMVPSPVTGPEVKFYIAGLQFPTGHNYGIPEIRSLTIIRSARIDNFHFRPVFSDERLPCDFGTLPDFPKLFLGNTTIRFIQNLPVTAPRISGLLPDIRMLLICPSGYYTRFRVFHINSDHT